MVDFIRSSFLLNLVNFIGKCKLLHNKPLPQAVCGAYVYLDGIVLKRSWAGEITNVSVLVAIGVNDQGFREVLGITEAAKEDKAGWFSFLQHLKKRGLKGVRLFITDACMGLGIPGGLLSSGQMATLYGSFSVWFREKR